MKLGVLLICVCVASGCGAQVVFEGEQGGGVGIGSGAGSGQGASTVGGGSGQGGAVSAELDAACEEFCTHIPQCANLDFCPTSCEAYHIPGCETQGATVLRCLVDTLDVNCVAQQGECFSEITSFQKCIEQNGCTQQSCYEEGDTCNCEGKCNGTPVHNFCYFDGTKYACQCDAEGLSAFCEQDSLDCSLTDSCCALAF